MSDFTQNIELDAALVRAAAVGLFEWAAVNLGLTPSEAFGRSEWLKAQPEPYVKAVSDRVAVLMGKPEKPGRAGTLFVVCIQCGAKETYHVSDVDAVTDAEATIYFEALGWSVLPTLCPAHNKAGDRGVTRA